jgi:hypothetical protein
LRRREGRSSKLHYTRAYLAADSTDWPNSQDPTDQSNYKLIYFRKESTTANTPTRLTSLFIVDLNSEI